MAKLLLNQGQCTVDPLNNRRQTPLLLAVSQGHAALVELLVGAGADVTASDEDGDTGIHVACLKLHSLQGEANPTLSPNIYNVRIFRLLFCKIHDTIIKNGLYLRSNNRYTPSAAVAVTV